MTLNMASVRARFFDDYRLSRIEEEVDRISLNSDISCSVDAATANSICPSSAFTAQRSASADGNLESTPGADNDDDDVSADDDLDDLPLPPPPLNIELKSTAAVESLKTPPGAGQPDFSGRQQMDDLERLAALQFMQAKYDSLGKLKIHKPTSSGNVNFEFKASTADSTASNAARRDLASCHFHHQNGIVSSSCSGSGTRVTPTSEICFRLQQSAAAVASRHDVDNSNACCCQQQQSHKQSYMTTKSECQQQHSHHHQHHHQQPTSSKCHITSSQCNCDCSHDARHTPSSNASCEVNQTAVLSGSTVDQIRQIQPYQQQHESEQRQQQLHSHRQQSSADAASASASGVSTTTTRPLPLSTAELFQVDLFYRSSKTIVHVSPSTATLYFSTTTVPTPQQQHQSNHKHSSHHHQHNGRHNHQNNNHTVIEPFSANNWKPVATGIPVVIVDKRRSAARLYVILAERGTGFELWRQPVDRVDQYVPVFVANEPVFHMMTATSTSGTNSTGNSSGPVDNQKIPQRVGLYFDEVLPATEFHRQLLRMAELERAGGLNGNGRSHGKAKKLSKDLKGKLKSRAVVSFTKADISQPCCFTHVTRLERDVTNSLTLCRQGPTASSRPAL